MQSEGKASSTVCFGGTGLPTVEPEQTCEACGTIGTVGRVVLNFRGRSEREIHRFCEQCWPEECARYEARWKHRHANTLDELFASEGSSEQNADTSQSDQKPVIDGIACESATWHNTADYVEKFVELLDMVRGGRVPTEAEMLESAVGLANQLEANIGDYIGTMPLVISQFLAEFGSHGDAAEASHARRIPAGATRAQTFARELARIEARRASRTTIRGDSANQSLNENIAAAHASADAVIAEFDKALESLTAPATLESRVEIEKELVEMLQQLEQEIATEASALEAWQSELELATKSGDAYTAAKLSRQGENRMLRLHGLRSTIADVEELHVRLLGKVQ